MTIHVSLKRGGLQGSFLFPTQAPNTPAGRIFLLSTFIRRPSVLGHLDELR